MAKLVHSISASTLTTKSIGDLAKGKDEQPVHYHIPDYQRGYRWKPENVKALLDDLWEFFKETIEGTPKTSFYCLQPLVVARPKESNVKFDYEVIDGQQRLTTLFLILSHLCKTLNEDSSQLFKISYATRDKTNQMFLKNIHEENNQEQADTIDIFYLSTAYKTIQEWVKGQMEDKRKRQDFLKFLLRTGEPHAGVIWYELDLKDEPNSAIDVFTRLNIGKIRLTDDELIRALFLRRDGEEDFEEEIRQYTIAYEWDQMEKALQADDFWLFLSNEIRPGHNRIGLLFEFLFEIEAEDELKNSDDPYRIFHFFNNELKKSKSQDCQSEWLKVRNLFQLFEDWFLDHRLFHLIGFLIHHKKSLKDIYDLLQKSSSRSDFDKKLRDNILHDLFSETGSASEHISNKLNKITYDDRIEVRSILLLFNIATILQHPDSNMRFQFDRFKIRDGKKNNWDIEHIHSVTPPETGSKQKEWLEQCRKYLEPEEGIKLSDEDNSLVHKITEFCDSDASAWTNEKFDELHRLLLKRIQGDTDSRGEPDEPDKIGNLGNLTLLDSSTNRSYKNAFFAVKRQRIIELDREGTFLPLCTRNAFLKVYNSESAHLLRWMKDDRTKYKNNIYKTLVNLFTEEKKEL